MIKIESDLNKDIKEEDSEGKMPDNFEIAGLILLMIVVGGAVFTFYPRIEQTTLYVEVGTNLEISNLRIADENVSYLLSRESQKYNIEMASFNRFIVDFLDDRGRTINSTIIPLESLRIGEYPIKIDEVPEEAEILRVSIVQGEQTKDSKVIRLNYLEGDDGRN